MTIRAIIELNDSIMTLESLRILFFIQKYLFPKVPQSILVAMVAMVVPNGQWWGEEVKAVWTSNLVVILKGQMDPTKCFKSGPVICLVCKVAIAKNEVLKVLA